MALFDLPLDQLERYAPAIREPADFAGADARRVRWAPGGPPG